MSLFSFLKKNKESYSLVFNIGSGSISGGIIKFTEKAGVDISYYAKEVIPFQQEISVPKHVELMKSSLSTLVGKIRAEGLKKISNNNDYSAINRVFYVFSSPWSASQTKTIKISESKEFKVTESYLNRVIDQQEKLFQIDIAKSGRIIERKIIQMKINGYVVDSVSDKLAKDLEISVFFTVIPEEILNEVEKIVSKSFLLKNIWCHSATLSSFLVIRNLFPQKDDYIHIDVSEEITDISIIKDNIITSSASIPFGRNHFLRELSLILKVSEEIADSMITMYGAKTNDELASLKLSVAIHNAGGKWLEKIYEILDSFKDRIYVPDSIFLIVNNDLAPFLKDKLQKKDFKIILVDNKKIRPHQPGDDTIFKLELMFLDNLYKI